jgi:hypothetical protein
MPITRLRLKMRGYNQLSFACETLLIDGFERTWAGPGPASARLGRAELRGSLNASSRATDDDVESSGPIGPIAMFEIASAKTKIKIKSPVLCPKR